MKMHDLEFDKMGTQEFIKLIFTKENINKLKVVDKIDNALAFDIILDGFKRYFEIFDGYLIIQDAACFDNINLYREFMSDSDREKHGLFKYDRTTTKDANDIDIVAGTTVTCLDDIIGGDNDTESDWDIVKGETYKVSHLYDDDNLIVPMVVIEGSKNGAFMAYRFQVK